MGGFDPTQRDQQWKRRVNREEQGIVYGVRARPLSGMSHGGLKSDGRLGELLINLAGLEASRYKDVQQGEKEPSDAGSRRSSSASAIHAGKAITGQGRTPSRCSEGTASSALRAELDEERKARVAVEAELKRLQGILESEAE